jgi:glutamyl-tRNA(Gln) amidotransferase subunit E
MTMMIDAKANYEATRKEVGYVSRNEATQSDYDRIGFMSGLEVHQQLKTKHKLFCRCPAGIYQKPDEFDARLIRHMRPTLSELGEYDGTALMEFKTKKEIIYQISNDTACTYDIDDTPPFHIDRQALEIAIRISLLSKLNIVGEVHVARKQYLDGSIPTGFQRTAIIGVEGEIHLKHKKVRLIQLSLEEDSCREVSDIRHTRIYRTDRLGMPLIETVTYPDCVNPDEVKEACDYIRFLNRSTGLVRTGIGSGREDVNVSCRGGSRVEIKGVAHTRWIPELTHNEAFRQWALLNVRKILLEKNANPHSWDMQFHELKGKSIPDHHDLNGMNNGDYKVFAVSLPGFKGLLSHFTQPGHTFADELYGRLKVIACLEPPFMLHPEMQDAGLDEKQWSELAGKLQASADDALMLVWGPEEDMPTALDSIRERCKMAFEGIPNETRKSFEDGTTIFERVLPGADRMYPDTDTPPLPLPDDLIENLKKELPSDVIDRINQLKNWKIPGDTYTYILSRNYFDLIRRLIDDQNLEPAYAGTFIGHSFRFIEGHYTKGEEFRPEMIYGLFKFLRQKNIHFDLAKLILPHLYEHPKMDFDSMIEIIKFRKVSEDQVISLIPFLKNKFRETARVNNPANETNWIMGQLRKKAMGNISLKKLSEILTNK